ncbi:protein kinase [Solirubrobacter sp. CPCC 204708]|uniref:non-specific serine/threonine protein kinase n=1 Tax=Solirubrobacter deserti TaxID=2282478 RepID=A0ABT4RTG5_9ACTN|nr:serine/threonine-protein kinase [Solirubrobacter deserti]MBE2320771.1 protein kinase [Solirubrobacter deserti]MDA0141874.1 protein kinase [Solirubrobacter deserti]
MEVTVFAERYRAVRRLGHGGTATVFLAQDERLQREVAIKRVHGAEVTATTAKRLWREARIMASLRHPNLVAIYDIVVDDEDLLLVMEYVEGRTLADVLASAPLTWQRTAELLEPIVSALDYAHSKGVVHRDLKPANVLVGDDGSIKVADLGLATAAEITKITPPGAIMGTPAYMAPEQARPGTPTAAADVFALATIAFEALSGSLPRWGPGVAAILAQATREPPADLREHWRDAPAGAARALIRGMSPIPEDRQQSASDLLRELTAGFTEAPTTEPAPASVPSPTRPAPAVQSHPQRHRRARTLVLTALAVAALVTVAVLASRRASPPSTTAPPLANATPDRTPRVTPSPAASPAATPSPASATATAAPRPSRSATATVRAFYRRAAAGEYAGAWSLAGPRMRQAFGNDLQRFTRDLSSLQRIEFERITVIARDKAGATIAIRSIATHANRVDRCAGTLRAVRRPGRGWLVEPASLQCTSS